MTPGDGAFVALEQIAARLLRLTIDNFHPQWNVHMRVVTEQLHQVWNARGAADIAAVDTLRSDSHMTAAVIKALDR